MLALNLPPFQSTDSILIIAVALLAFALTGLRMREGER